MAKFDPTKPHGTISGEHEARFEQDGKLFNASVTRCVKGAAKVNQNVATPAGREADGRRPGREAA
jgi:hypothetical protein